MQTKNVLAIISEYKWKGKNNYFEQAKFFYDKVFILDPLQISYRFNKGESVPTIFYNKEPLEDLSMLLILTIPKGYKRDIIFLIKVLEMIGCPVSDNFEKFTDYNIGKGQELLNEHVDITGTDSLVFSSYSSAKQILESDLSHDMFPMLYKPIFGGKGRGIVLLNTPKEALVYLEKIFKSSKNFVLLERFMDYKDEWRIYIVDGIPLCSYRKIKVDGQILANYSLGGLKLPAENMNEIYRFVLENMPDIHNRGIYGIDIAKTIDGDIHIIETNRCPGFTGVNELCNMNFHYEAHKILFKRARKFHS